MSEFCMGCGHAFIPSTGRGVSYCGACLEVTVKSKTIDHPDHYGGADNPYEAIKVIEAWDLGFCLGNAVKYIARAGKKGDRINDLKKAIWYLQREVQ